MGQELEFKLAVRDPAQLAEILADHEVAALCGPWREIKMETTYYDTPSRALSTRKWMLRRRCENGSSVVCVKVPLEDHLRGEWEIAAACMNRETVQALVRSGAPAELPSLCAAGLVPVCGAAFLRRAALLRFPDGSSAELAGDHGVLRGSMQELPFTEVELELCGGSPAAMQVLAEALCRRYSLHEEPLSKFARARQLK